MDPKALTFEQAAGIEPLPTQMRSGEVSPEIRARLYSIIQEHISRSLEEYGSLAHPWDIIVKDFWVQRLHRFSDDAPDHPRVAYGVFKPIYGQSPWHKVYGTTQWLMRHPRIERSFHQHVDFVLRDCRAAYRVVDRDTLMPVATEQEAATVAAAVSSLSDRGFRGAVTHLKNAAGAATEGNWTTAVRESIHSVESVARMLDPNASTLGPALATLQRQGTVHPALRSAFEKLYGFTSDEKGVRHALLDDGDARIDEATALFMLGACAAFCSYLMAKSLPSPTAGKP